MPPGAKRRRWPGHRFPLPAAKRCLVKQPPSSRFCAEQAPLVKGYEMYRQRGDGERDGAPGAAPWGCSPRVALGRDGFPRVDGSGVSPLSLTPRFPPEKGRIPTAGSNHAQRPPGPSGSHLGAELTRDERKGLPAARWGWQGARSPPGAGHAPAAPQPSPGPGGAAGAAREPAPRLPGTCQEERAEPAMSTFLPLSKTRPGPLCGPLKRDFLPKKQREARRPGQEQGCVRQPTDHRDTTDRSA